MARKPDIQYISQFYVPGSEAQVIEFKPVKQPKKRRAKTVLPKAEPKKKIRLKVDNASLVGLVLAAVMVICLAVTVFQYLDACEEHRIMTDRVIMLQNQNVALREEYRAGYDVEEITLLAEAMGMIKKADAQTVRIRVEIPEPEAEPTWWENTCWFFEELFA